MWRKLFSVAALTLLLSGCGVSNKNENSQQAGDSHVTESQLATRDYESGKSAVVTVNGGKATLNANDWQNNEVKYSQLDHLNRTADANTGYLERRNVANGSLRVRQFVRPTGWHQKFSDGEAIVNRGHLIAYSVSKGIATSGHYNPDDVAGDQNNPKNLFTQTGFTNQKIQTIYESKVRSALLAGKKVVYQAHALFRGNELMARGVQLQAISTDGTLNFNVYIYNVQPGYRFDYQTGTSTVDSSMTVPTPAGAPSFNHQRQSNNYQSHRRQRHHNYY